MSPINVLVTGKLLGKSNQRLSSFAQVSVCNNSNSMAKEELVKELTGADALVCILGDSIDAEVMQSCPDLKLIANVAVGYDNIDVACATQCGILVTNTPGVLDNATADLAMSLLLACARRICEADRYVRQGKWHEWNIELMLGVDLYGKTLGIVGMGRIGMAVARRAAAFGMKIIYARSGQEDSRDYQLHKELDAQRVSLDTLLSNADFVSLHCPLTENTSHLIGERELARMKPGSILINTSRGAVVNEKALLKALQEGKLGGAGLDVYEQEPHVPHELLLMDNVVLTPHIGSAGRETRIAMADLAVDGLITAFSGKPPGNMVNKDTWSHFIHRIRTRTS